MQPTGTEDEAAEYVADEAPMAADVDGFLANVANRIYLHGATSEETALPKSKLYKPLGKKAQAAQDLLDACVQVGLVSQFKGKKTGVYKYYAAEKEI